MKQRAFENIVGKGENAGNQHFLLLPQCFLTFQNQILLFLFTFIFQFKPAYDFVVW